MCGISGFLDASRTRASSELEAIAGRMADALAHRGPDDSGVWVDEAAGIALGHRRLSIIDLSPEGHQPMFSRSGRYGISFNGEIYNYRQLRSELQQLGHSFRGHSDTEIMLEGIDQWGLRKALDKFNGMFAFALWDKKEAVLSLARDRLGEKPLYYGSQHGAFYFASELKALRRYPGFPTEVDRESLALYLRHNCIPAPYSIYKNVRKLPPGTFLQISAEAVPTSVQQLEPQAYWSARDVAEDGVREPFQGSDAEALAALEELFGEAVEMRMEADVPLGAFLSGGIDSSTVVALMQSRSQRPIKTFTIGFHEARYNEAEDAKRVAAHLGTEHTELYVSHRDALEVVPRLPQMYDEPFADSSQIPTFLVSEMTRKHVTVSLSGDGGDELFSGYNRYAWGQDIWNKIGWMPKSLRRAGAKTLSAASPQAWERLFSALGPVLPGRLKQRNPGEKMQKLAQVLGVQNPEALYLRLVSHWKRPADLVLGAAGEHPTVITDQGQWPALDDFTMRMMYLDLMWYLPDDILAKVDRASMAVSLESRVPFLDHRLVEFAWKLPLSMKIRDGKGKWLLRELLYKHVPKELIERPKMGFGVPIDDWLRGPLREWAQALLSAERLRREAFFDPAPITQKWQEHLSGRRDWHYYLWDILMFQAWLEKES